MTFPTASELAQAVEALALAEKHFAASAADHLANRKVGTENVATASDQLAEARAELRRLVSPRWPW